MTTQVKKMVTEAELLDLTREITLVTWTNKRLVVRPNDKFKYRVYAGDEVLFSGNYLDVAAKAYNGL